MLKFDFFPETLNLPIDPSTLFNDLLNYKCLKLLC